MFAIIVILYRLWVQSYEKSSAKQNKWDYFFFAETENSKYVSLGLSKNLSKVTKSFGIVCAFAKQ